MARELILYCDESDISGRHYSNFYGGALVESQHQAEVIARLNARKAALNFHSEVKWQKITENYAQKYCSFVDETFALMVEGKLKMRVMFTHNYFSAHRLTGEQRENGFFLLYYQFVKHAFGLQFAGTAGVVTGVRMYFDKLPDTAERTDAKEGVHRHINRHIRALYGGRHFNVGVSTGRSDLDGQHEWHDPYRHWRFNPNDAVARREFAKARHRQG